jgi:DNA-binding SARP family transcriptional activator
MEFLILGPLEVADDGRLVPLGGAKQRAVLAILLLNRNQVVSTDRLIDEVWGETPPATAAISLQNFVARLRKALAESGRLLVTRPPGYLIQLEPDQLDLDRFERLTREARQQLAAGEPRAAAGKLEEALALWRGPPLADFTYEPFAQPAVARLDELRLAALEDRFDAELALGRHAELVAELEALVDEHPLRERLRGQLMLALYRSGRQAEALDVYQATRRVLVDELGIDPGPALQQLERAILTQDAAIALATEDAVERRSILLIPHHDVGLESLAALAEPLASSHEPHGVILAQVIDAANGAGGLSAAVAELDAYRQRLDARGVPARIAAFTSSQRGKDVIRLASEQDVDLLLVAAPEETLVGVQLESDLAEVLAESPCDVAVLATSENRRLRNGPVLVTFGGAEHDWAALELAAWIASAQQVPLKLLGLEGDPAAGQRDASRLLASASLAVQQVARIVPEPVLLQPGADGVLAEAATAGWLIIGLPTQWRTEALGDVRSTIVHRAVPPTLVVRRGPRPGGLAPRETMTRFTWSLSGSP